MDHLRASFHSAVAAANSTAMLEQVRVQFLGKSSEIAQLMKGLGSLPPEERKTQGAVYNELRQNFELVLSEKAQVLELQELNQTLASDSVDVTLPVRRSHQGRLHPLTQAIHEATQILMSMGFVLADGPEIEDDYHNFTALNVPPSHPARQMQDTFYVNAKGLDDQPMVLRTQTSSVQIRALTKHKAPLKIIVPGRVYRNESDATHTPNFHQIEGLYIDKGIHMGHLKACLLEFCRRFFEKPDLTVRFRPSFFPFTEPSAEMDICCTRNGGQMILGEGTDWLEILGCGMVHPKVLEGCGIDSTEYQGFAWGMGADRLAMLKYGLTDLLAFFEGDARWSDQCGFSAGRAL